MSDRVSRCRPITFSLVVLLAAWSIMGAAQDRPARAGASPLEAYADPAEAGFSPAVLNEARALADTSRSGAVVALHRGKVIAAWGAIDRPFMAHSIRKSLAGALYGQAVAAGALSMSATLADLGVDETPSLTPAERGARVRDLMAARSGVYHAAAYAGADQQGERPARGSHAPGTFWFYNNWDFNALETIYQRVTKQDIYQAFERHIAGPLGMEDFTTSGQLRALEPGQSQYPAHTFRISARDLARFGQMYLDGGRWGSTQVVPRDWVRESLRAHSDTGGGVGYGLLWWIYSKDATGGDRYPALAGREVYLARGTGGQALFLIPSAEMVVVHRADTDNGRTVQGPVIWKLVDLLVGARTGQAANAPRVQPVGAVPFASQAPARPAPPIVRLLPDALGALTGDYVMPQGAVIRVFLHGDRLFANVPGQGEAELFATSATRFVALVQPGASVEFIAGPDGRAQSLRLTLGRDVIEAARR